MDNPNPPLRQRYEFSDFLYYSALVCLPFFTACYAISHRSAGWTVFYILLSLIAAALVYRHYCSHCPHYNREGKTTRCMFFWGMPKFFRRRPGPLAALDKSVAVLAPAVIVIFPLPWMIQQPGLLLIYGLSLLIFSATIRRHECKRCIYFDCPVNRVPEDMRGGEDA